MGKEDRPEKIPTASMMWMKNLQKELMVSWGKKNSFPGQRKRRMKRKNEVKYGEA